MADQVDKTTVGVTPAGATALERLMSTGWFTEEIDAYRLAIACAISKALVVSASLPGVQTKFNVGTLNKDDQVRTIVAGFSDEAGERPFAHAEKLADVGLKYLVERLVDREETLSSVLLDLSEEDVPAPG